MPRVSSHFGLAEPRLMTLTMPLITNVTNIADANTTYTPAQLMSGLITRNMTAARTDTLPSAAAMVEACQGAIATLGLSIPGLLAGTSFEFFIRNISTSTLTVALGAGGVVDAPSTMTVVTLNTRGFKFIFTNVGIGTEAYTVIGIGTSAH